MSNTHNTTITIRIPKETKTLLYNYCDRYGLKLGKFIERVILQEINNAKDKGDEK